MPERNATNAQILDAILELTRQVGGLSENTIGLRRDMENAEKRAQEQRELLHGRVSELKGRIETVEHRQTTGFHRLDSVEEVSRDTADWVQQRRQLESSTRMAWGIARRIGVPAWNVIKWFGFIVAFLVAATWREIKDWIITGGPTP